jgi:Patatin-like phospholipase
MSFGRKVASVLVSLCRHYWLYAAVGAAIVAIPLILAAWWLGLGWAAFAGLLALDVLPLVLFAILGAATGLLLDVLFRLPKNDFGICTGSGPVDPANPDVPPQDDAGVAPLTDWLHELFQSAAGRTIKDDPVTFGHLWGTDDELAERDIDLVLMTTDATRGVSHRFPFVESVWGPLYFNEHEFAKLFPPRVVECLVNPELTPEEKAKREEANDEKLVIPPGFHRLPPARALPILVGARMSLSFPFLLSQVPLYSPQYRKDTATLKRCLFSDGGLTSNFPIHFFDAPIPSRPTFGINLVPDTVTGGEKGAEPELEARRSPVAVAKDPWLNVWMPTTNSTGIQDVALFHEIASGPWAVIDFFMMLFDTARNWGDTELSAMPGYRDRIVHVALADNEGGLNLSMPPETVRAIGERGECAGTLLAARFASHPGKDPKTKKAIRLTWDNHRWIRYRTFMAAFELVGRKFGATWQRSDWPESQQTYPELLEEPPSYKLTAPQQRFAAAATEKLVDMVGSWTESFDHPALRADGRSPRPKPILRVMPPGTSDPRAEWVG